MKTYRKPKLMVLSLSGDSLLCSCVIDAVEPGMNAQLKATLEEIPGLDLSDTTKLFAVNDEIGCENPIDIDIYCKMSPSDTFKVFAS